jgi:peptidoglycan/xylan/chitin deacetylase (PgdA/CDA1 family)
VLCDHTEHHVEHLDQRPAAQIQVEVGAAAADLQAITGQRPAFYRAPGGSLSPAVIGIANRAGMTVLGWSIDPRDWRAKSPDAVLGYLLAGIRPGAIILLHDGGGNRSATVTQLRELIHTLAARGYRFTTPA